MKFPSDMAQKLHNSIEIKDVLVLPSADSPVSVTLYVWFKRYYPTSV